VELCPKFEEENLGFFSFWPKMSLETSILGQIEAFTIILLGSHMHIVQIFVTL
jgi:hypothetical protein